jgi:hypothetical protein
MRKVFVSPEVVAAAAAVGINVDPTDPNGLAYVKEQFALIGAAAEKLAASVSEPVGRQSGGPVTSEGIEAVLVYDNEARSRTAARFHEVPRVGEFVTWGAAPLVVTAVEWCGSDNNPERPCVPWLHVRIAGVNELPGRQRRIPNR